MSVPAITVSRPPAWLDRPRHAYISACVAAYRRAFRVLPTHATFLAGGQLYGLVGLSDSSWPHATLHDLLDCPTRQLQRNTVFHRDLHRALQPGHNQPENLQALRLTRLAARLLGWV